MTAGGFDTALDFLTSEILAGRLSKDARLPNERELATQLGTSRSAVREAIKVLQAQGVITSHTGPGRGTRVAASQGPALGRMLKLHVALDAISFDELTETRVVLERAAAEAAAVHADDASLADLGRLAESMVAVSDTARFNELDTAFHVAIAGLGANRLIRDMTIAIREAVARPILGAEERIPNWEALRLRLLAEHAGIHRALSARDGANAANLCEAHIRGAHRVLLPGSR
ncbi:FadR family transcriptional regulator [Tessaracoccus sp. MC1679]|uniref:FadR/GntR family transcriptional regulator n=1 Tax=Tessaracoccus sp. MC1679 TaxID=2760313 RepID=UPI0016013FA4|nr:FCD domain-containing protein [Tessaracoccus sp. MC1679]MBB1516054.1 FadR family transcriptional regulator [Tessaracoccus sp. MC1679]